MNEIWDAYRRDGHRLDKKIVKGSEIPEGLYHLSSEVFVVHKDESILCLRRSYDKEQYAGYYETTIRGYALQGEDALECVDRELKEKLGIQAYNLQLVNTIIDEKKHCIYKCYTCSTNCVHDEIVSPKSEAFTYKWFTKDEFLNIIKEGYVLPSQYIHFFSLFIKLGYVKSLATSDIIGKPIEVLVDELYKENGRDEFDMVLGANKGHIEGLYDELNHQVEAYVIGVDRPVTIFDGTVVAIVTYPFTSNSSKLIVAPSNALYTIDQIERLVANNEPGVNSLIKMR